MEGRTHKIFAKDTRDQKCGASKKSGSWLAELGQEGGSQKRGQTGSIWGNKGRVDNQGDPKEK